MSVCEKTVTVHLTFAPSEGAPSLARSPAPRPPPLDPVIHDEPSGDAGGSSVSSRSKRLRSKRERLCNRLAGVSAVNETLNLECFVLFLTFLAGGTFEMRHNSMFVTRKLSFVGRIAALISSIVDCCALLAAGNLATVSMLKRLNPE